MLTECAPRGGIPGITRFSEDESLPDHPIEPSLVKRRAINQHQIIPHESCISLSIGIDAHTGT